MVRAFAIVLAGALVATPAMAEIGRVKLASGAAVIERGTARIPARAGVQLEQGDRLATGKDGRITVTFADNTRFSAGPNSRIGIDEFQFNARERTGTFRSSVERGSLAVVSGQIAKSRQDAMRMRVRKSWLGVRGTRFVVNAG